jgi:hypothetical protein
VGIVYPFVAVPPTLLLMHDGAVRRVQPTVSVPLPPDVVSGQDPVLLTRLTEHVTATFINCCQKRSGL